MIIIYIINLLLELTECPKLRGCTSCNDDQTKCNSCNTKLHYNSNPNPDSGECECDHSNYFYDYEGTCKEVSEENCNTGCKLCFTTETQICAECDTSNFFKLDNGKCICDSSANFELGKGEDSNKCVCIKGYTLYNNRCLDIKFICHSGCKVCYRYDSECIECKENFELKTNKYRCSCKDGFVLDEYKSDTEDRCVEAFPTKCPQGCNCDEKFNCISCQNNFVPVYYEDLTTIKSCNKTIDCSQDNCQKCNEIGECLICKDGYIYSKLKSKCIIRDESIKCSELGCLQCDSENGKCEVCANGYYIGLNIKNEAYCYLLTAEPLKILYLELTDSNIAKKDGNKVNIDLRKIPEQKRRPYYYSLGENFKEITINNDDNLDFQIILPYRTGELTIIDSEGSNKNPPYIIQLHGNHDINYQSSKFSLEGYGEVTLHSEKEVLEINKLTYSSNSIIINHDKNIKINEINIHDRDNDNAIRFTPIGSNSNLDVSVNTLILHQNSYVKINQLNIDTLKVESKGSVESDKITVQNIEINILRASIDGSVAIPINGNIFGIPKSIKVNIDQEGSPFWLEEIYISHPLEIASGRNEEFIQNCESWAEVYNKNPTDPIFNYAKCDISNNYARLYINHKDDEKKGGGSKAGLIAGVVIAIIVVGVVVFLLVYFLVIKKRKQNNESSTQQDVGQQNEEE